MKYKSMLDLWCPPSGGRRLYLACYFAVLVALEAGHVYLEAARDDAALSLGCGSYFKSREFERGERV